VLRQLLLIALFFPGKQEAKEKRDDRKRRRAENELKSASYQVVRFFLLLLYMLRGVHAFIFFVLLQISDPTKLKRMSKKQLRSIKKTRMNPQTGVVEIVGAYS
jgi:cytoskeletal protein RodZ